MKHGSEREEDGRSDESSFSREARKYITREFREAWRAAVASGEVQLAMYKD